MCCWRSAMPSWASPSCSRRRRCGPRLGPDGHDGPEDVDTGADRPGRDRRGDPGVSAAWSRNGRGWSVLELATLLLQQNRRLPRTQRQWGEIERLIDQIAAAAPGEAEPALLLARLLRVQGQEAKAFDVLDDGPREVPQGLQAVDPAGAVPDAAEESGGGAVAAGPGRQAVRRSGRTPAGPCGPRGEPGRAAGHPGPQRAGRATSMPSRARTAGRC